MIKHIKQWTAKIVALDNDKNVDNNRNLWAIVKLCTSFGKLQQASAALTYHTLFAIVPVMALMVAITLNNAVSANMFYNYMHQCFDSAVSHLGIYAQTTRRTF